MINPNGLRCPDCVGSQRVRIKQYAEMPSRQGNREKGSHCPSRVPCRGVYFCVSKEEPDCRFRVEVQFNFLCNSYKLILKFQTKIRERTCIAICRRKVSRDDFIRYDTRRKQESWL